MNDSIDKPNDARQGEQICWQCGATYGPDQDYCVEDGSELVEVNPSETRDMLVGHIFDERFRVLAKLGEGGMSRVYHARRVEGGEEVALKILKADFLQDTEIRKRFMYEARVIANLDHPNAVELYDFGQSPDGSFYMVMEHLQGESLGERLDDSNLRYRTIFEYLAPICGVLDQAHQQDIVHRDLKPENIYLKREARDTFRPKLLDFGIAKHLRSRTMTQDDAMWGTPAYMSPEQASGDDVTAASDVYAMGVMLYELIAGVLPLRASTSMGFAVKHMQSDVRPLKELPGIRDLPEALNELALAMLAKDPEDRPESMREVEEELNRIADEDLFPHQFDVVPAEQVEHAQLVTPEEEEGAEAGKESGRLEMDDEMMDAKTQALDGGEVQRAAAETPTNPGANARETVTGGETVDIDSWASQFGNYHVATVAIIMLLAGGLAGGTYWMLEVREGAGKASARADDGPTPSTETNPSSISGVETRGPDVGESPRRQPQGGSAVSVGRAATYGADVLMRARDVANAIEAGQKSREPSEPSPETRRRWRRQQADESESDERESQASSSEESSTDESASGEDEEIDKALETTF